MLDLSLLLLFLTKDIESYKVYGEYTDIHSSVGALMQQKEELDGNSDLILIYKENHTFVDYFWRNILTHKTKWFIIKTKSKNDANIIYKELRSMGDCYLSTDHCLVILKNIKEDFRDHFRESILSPVEKMNILDFFDFVGGDEDISDCEIIYGNFKDSIVGSLMSRNPHQYIGNRVDDKYIRLCMFLSKARIKFIEFINNGEISGIFMANDFVKDAWIYHLSKVDDLRNVFRFREKHIKIFLEN